MDILHREDEVIAAWTRAHASAMCPVCDALKRLPQIDDDEADEIVLGSQLTAWCEKHWRAWLAVRAEPQRGRERQFAIIKRASG